MFKVMSAKKLTKAEQAQQLYKQGMSKEDIKAIVYPDQNSNASSVSLSRALKGLRLQPVVIEALEENKIELTEMIKQYKSELKAMKPIYFKGGFVENVPDYPTRQKARDALVRLLHAYDLEEPTVIPDNNSNSSEAVDVTRKEAIKEALTDAIKSGDVDTIERIAFKNDK